MKKDRVLLAEDTQRKENSYQAMDILERSGVTDWDGFADTNTKVLGIRGGSGQVHVGDVFRAVFPTLEYFRARNMKLVLASSPGLENIFKGWEDVLKIIDASKEPEEIANDFKAAGTSKVIKWGILHRNWKRLLKHTFDDASRPVVKTAPLDLVPEDVLKLRQQYSEDGQKRVLGIIWRTSMIGRDPSRNATLKDFLPIVSHKPDKWNVISLQYGSMDVTANEIANFSDKSGNRVIFDQSIDPMHDYVGASNQMAACDHIVAIDCSQIFQAGATGVPVSVLLSADPAKQWGEFMQSSTDICPFFPDTGRVFIQKKDGNWVEPVERALQRAISESKLQGVWSHPAAQKIKHSFLIREVE
jgi:hypothetical protein